MSTPGTPRTGRRSWSPRRPASRKPFDMLLEKGADPNVRTKRNETALADAATAGNEEAVKLLLDRGAEVNVQDIRGYSPLLYAAGSDAMPAGVVKLLLAKGADRTAKGDGETAPMLAAKRGDSGRGPRRSACPGERTRKPSDWRAHAGRDRRTAPSPRRSARRSPCWKSRAATSSASPAATPATHRTCPRPPPAIARSRGLPAPKEIPQLPQSMHALNPDRIMDLAVVGVVGLGWEMFDFGNNGVPQGRIHRRAVRYIEVDADARPEIGRSRKIAGRR